MIAENNLGVAMSGASTRAVELFDAAVANTQRFTGDPVAELDEALADSPGFVMAHLLRAYLHLIGTDPGAVDMAGASLHQAAKLEANTHEIGHIRAVEHLINGEWRAACRVLEDISVEDPKDAVALQIGHVLDLVVGDTRMLRDRIARALPAWSRDMPGYSAVIGMYAFGLEETGDYGQAEAFGRLAIDLERRDGWARHAVAHVLEMQSRPEDGLAWMLGDAEAWSKDSFFAVHNWWHTALYHLELGEIDQVLALYDGPIAGEPTYLAFDMVDASAMLWRLTLRGVDVGERWQPLAEAWMTQAKDSIFAFNDAHAMMAFAQAGRSDGVEAVRDAQDRSLKEAGDNRETIRMVGAPVAEGLLAFADGDYRRALSLLRPVRNIASRFGGSHAQRDLLDLTIIEAAHRAGDLALERALAAERCAARPDSRSARQLLTRATEANRRSAA